MSIVYCQSILNVTISNGPLRLDTILKDRRKVDTPRVCFEKYKPLILVLICERESSPLKGNKPRRERWGYPRNRFWLLQAGVYCEVEEPAWSRRRRLSQELEERRSISIVLN